MKLAALPGLFFHKIQIHRLRFYNLNFNEIKYYKADECVIIRRQARISRGAGEATETGLPKMSQMRGLPLQIMLP